MWSLIYVCNFTSISLSSLGYLYINLHGHRTVYGFPGFLPSIKVIWLCFISIFTSFVYAPEHTLQKFEDEHFVPKVDGP